MKKENLITLKNVYLNIPSLEGKNEYRLPEIIKYFSINNIFNKKNFKLNKKTNKKTNKKKLTLLRNLNIRINKGERVALIGRNGAGKTTFLRLISGIYYPSRGVLKKQKYFHPVIYKGALTSDELNGYQAAKAHYLYINNHLIGFNKYIEDVASFSELGEYLYKPVKIYSDGMKARLLFSIITGFKHDCLAMDEGLSAGDKNFIDKAQDRLDKFIGNTGTLILASHTNSLLQKFCNRGLVFERGEIKYDGKIDNALEFYDSM